MYLLCIIGFLIIFCYCITIIIKNRHIPNSISQIVYDLDNKNKWTFTLVMFMIAFMIVPQLMTVAATNNYTWLSFLTILGILGVGADPLDKNNKNIIHYVSAIIMGISSQILVFLLEPTLLFMWIPYVCYTLYETNSDKNIFFGETVMLVEIAKLCLL